jgi:hypothetical protein
MKNRQKLKSLIDYKSVQFLQMQNSYLSLDNRQFVKDFINRDNLFSMIFDNIVRVNIYDKMLRIQCIISFFYTFFENIKWLELCAKIIRNLLSSRCDDFIRTAIFKKYINRYQKNDSNFIQDFDHVLRKYKNNEHQIIEYEYFQLWMTTWRDFSNLISITSRKDVDKLKSQVKALNEQYWKKLTLLTIELEFEFNKFKRLQEQNNDWIMTTNFLK